MAGDFAVKIKLLNEFQCTENIVFFICLKIIQSVRGNPVLIEISVLCPP